MIRPLTIAAAVAAIAAPALAAPGAADWRIPDPENVLVIDTNKGRVVVELMPEVAPGHVTRVRELARAGLYDGRTFFRVIDQFMAQTGDPKDDGTGGSEKEDLTGEFTWRRGANSMFSTVAKPSGAELGFVGAMPAMSQTTLLAAMTADRKVSAWGMFCPGVLGMARGDNPDSANSQFFIMRQAYPSLDKRYTAFGRTLSGLEAVRSIKTGEPVPAPQDVMQKVRVLADIPAGQRPSVRVVDTKSAWFLAEVERVKATRGADFSPCDVDILAEVK
ncbi:peptidylprolyl isomerase [Caulobacter sp. NIBR2454]|uniref:peptidylprolyl isomerase n=1 Tax=Caulobacter sp. NIBR2454 TaxID=3015996 RepID=UPI0022B6207F|nr:peptidylprolyl isomerase [Caulobacter sp. NIBR2454]